MHFQKRLGERIWFALNEGPQVWIETPEELGMRGWQGEQIVELGFHEIRFRLRGDADVSKSLHPMKTWAQRAAAEAKKTPDPDPAPPVTIDASKIATKPPAKKPPVVIKLAPKKRNTLESDPTTPIMFVNSMVAPPANSKFIRAIFPQATTTAHPALAAGVDATTFAAMPASDSTPLETNKLAQVMDQFTFPQPIRPPTGTPRRPITSYSRFHTRSCTRIAERECRFGEFPSGMRDRSDWQWRYTSAADSTTCDSFSSGIRTVNPRHTPDCDRSFGFEMYRRSRATDLAKRAS